MIFNEMSHWDLIRMLFLEAYLRGTLLAAAAETHLGATLLIAAAAQYWKPYLGVVLLAAAAKP